jgi:hypothetical protein
MTNPDDPNPWSLSGPSLAVGWDHVCAISRAEALTPGEVWCWGANGQGQLGADAPSDGTPRRVPGFSARTRQGAVAVAAGKGFTCALRADGTVWCWGDNSQGQLGASASGPPKGPTQANIQGLAGVVSAGRAHACALLGRGEVQCWGDNTAGQVGDGSPLGVPAPAPATSIPRGASRLLADGDVSCALITERGSELWCWGADPRLRDRPPTPTPNLWATQAALAALGDDTACVWGAGEVTPRCVGRHPQAIEGLMDGGAFSEPLRSPVEVSRLDGAQALTFEARARCFIDRFGWPWCWGHNDQGQLGPDRPEPSSLEPAPIPLPGRATELGISGLGTLCARSARGEVWCWGSDADGGLGRGLLGASFDPNPSRVLGLPL